MQTEQIDVVIYHCLSCGAVLCQEADLAAPACCGKAMTKAVKETVDAGAPILAVGKIAENCSEANSENPRP